MLFVVASYYSTNNIFSYKLIGIVFNISTLKKATQCGF